MERRVSEEAEVETRKMDISQILKTFYVTFGSQYEVEEHPFTDQAHPRGYWKVLAPDELTARALLFGMLDNRWSMIYHENEFDPNTDEHLRWYPLGELAVIVTTVKLKGAPKR